MRWMSSALAAAVVSLGIAACGPQYVRVGAGVGPAPDCPYGYYDVAPYNCAPFGYYGPEWYVGGAFVGAGPWFHGERRFRGDVDNRFHPDHGYRGTLPKRGDRPEAGRRLNSANFHGNETRDGRGHVVGRTR